MALGSPKTNFRFTPNSKFHIFSDLFDHENKQSPLKFFQFWPSFFHVVLFKINPRCYKFCFTAYHTTTLTQKRRDDDNDNYNYDDEDNNDDYDDNDDDDNDDDDYDDDHDDDN